MLSWFQKMRRISSVGFGPVVAPHVTILPPRDAAFNDAIQVAAPVESTTTSAPRFAVSARTSLATSERL